jgi:hypothetical protein
MPALEPPQVRTPVELVLRVLLAAFLLTGTAQLISAAQHDRADERACRGEQQQHGRAPRRHHLQRSQCVGYRFASLSSGESAYTELLGKMVNTGQRLQAKREWTKNAGPILIERFPRDGCDF